MARSFPGYFSKAPARGRKRFRSPCRVITSSGKTVTLQFYMLKGNTDRTPTASSELALLLAGMGSRTITLPQSADHFEISRLLTSQHPKLATSSGGWLLYKALGGSGQRKLSVIPPETEGYNGHFLKTVTGGVKNTIYIVPLQDELDTSPLPPDANEFQKMPKASCRVCGSCMPLQVLAAHVKSCVEHPSSGDDFDLHGGSSPEVTIVAESIPPESTPGTSNTMRPNLAACPVCLIEYPLDYLQVHASSCGDSVEETPSRMQDASKSTEDEIENLDDVIQAIADAVTTDGKTFDITVSRQNMLGLVQWQRQKKASPTNQLKVIFLGDAGIDTGALRKEFLTGMVAGIEERFFEKGTHGRRPNYSLSDLDKGHFRTVGEIMAASLAQGGPAPNVLMPWCYKFLCTGSLDLGHLDKSDVGDDQYTDLLSKVEAATDTTIQVLTEEILNCGYTGLISLEKKGEIIRLMQTSSYLCAKQNSVREAQTRNRWR
ncbi:uncharacterized protein LOC117561507 isoform X3 [Gymnodraco acuticeps]|uniref:Uncharacterized protein LOC117561507 isoform X3 n=1 Tax=Gymnodraco acuticeps TaxID=8218 RepID=A0A6P8VV78_GYMAC|nr:uncharacterized protein LOC117561507 isoform X3 [Gymnodraco acuticeps]